MSSVTLAILLFRAVFFPSFLSGFTSASLFSPDLGGHCKQAYTNELEQKVSQLEEENERLRNRKVRPLLEDNIIVITTSA